MGTYTEQLEQIAGLSEDKLAQSAGLPRDHRRRPHTGPDGDQAAHDRLGPRYPGRGRRPGVDRPERVPGIMDPWERHPVVFGVTAGFVIVAAFFANHAASVMLSH